MKRFFTNFSDFMGFDGKFSPAHLWFILFLFIISILGILILKACKVLGGNKILFIIKKLLLSKMGLLIVIALTIITEIVPSIGGKGLILNLLMFLLGYVTYSDSDYIIAISKYRRIFAVMNICVIILGFGYFIEIKTFHLGIIRNLIEIILKSLMIVTAIVTIIGYGIKYLNIENKALVYLNKACFPIYIMHQTILLVLAFFILPLMLPTWLSILIVIVTSILITFTLYEVIRRTKYIGILIGIK